jgi:hypothetical protein
MIYFDPFQFWHRNRQNISIARRPFRSVSIQDQNCQNKASQVVLWSFKPGTYQTRSFAELTPKFQTCSTRSHKFRALSPTPNDWDPRAAFSTASTVLGLVPHGDWWVLIGFPTMACTLINTKEHKSSDWRFVRALGITQQELWQFRKSSRDNCWLAIPRPSDLRHKKCHIYH